MANTAKKGFEGLAIYRLSETLADMVWEMVLRWGQLAQDTVGKQLVRAADGIGANIAEGTGRGTYVDHRRFVDMARGSLYETTHWLRRAYRRRLVQAGETTKLKPVLEELKPRLNAYRNSLTARIRRPKKQITNNE